jgi:hypothetical protein
MAIELISSGAMKALDELFKYHNYHPRHEDTGGYNCRPITAGSAPSLHAHAIAVDVNWRTNPYGKRLITDMPRAMIDDIEKIRTKSGQQVWRWGGDWNGDNETNDSVYDAMHFECQASPFELSSGINWGTAIIGHPIEVHQGTDMVTVVKGGKVTISIDLPILAIGDKGPAVTKLQEMLKYNGATVTVDGAFGEETETAIKQLQAFFKLTSDGIVGGDTWKALMAIRFPLI